MKKRVLSLFLAITLCLTLTPTGALAAEGQPPEQTVIATQETETDAGENASPAKPEENPTEDAPAAAEKNTADKETGKEAGQNEPTAEGENEPLTLALDDAAKNAAEGENGEGSGGTHYVAESGGTQYETVQEILDNEEGEITLLDDVTEDITVYAATTIDMAGFSITGVIEATDSLTLTNGTVKGNVEVDSGTFTMTAPTDAATAIDGELKVISGSAYVSGAQVGVKGTLYFDGTDMLISGAVKAVELDSEAEPAAKTLYGSATVNGDTAAEAGFDTDTYKVGGEIAKKLTNKQVGSTTPAVPSLTLTETSKSLTAGKTAVFTANYTGTDTLNAYVQGSAVNGYFTISQKNNGDGTYTVSVKIDEETPGGTYTLFVHELGNTSVQASATITVTGLPDAAEVNGKQYKSLPRALDAAQDGDTVKLLADHTTNWSDVKAGEYATLAVVRKTLTLDLNLCTVDYLVVGDVVPDEESGILDSYDGNLTVVENVQGGSYGKIKNLEFLKGSLAIQGGRIGDFDGSKLTCKENSGTVTISGGMVCNATVGDGATVTVSGGTMHQGEWVNNGTLNIKGGTFGAVNFHNNSGTIAISGGTFSTLKNYDNTSPFPIAPISLLAPGHAFYKDNTVQDGSRRDFLQDVTVKEHTHTMVNNKCACGFSCTHTNTEGASTIDKDGKCTVCGTQFAAGIGETYYTDVPSALDAATDGQTVKLLANAMLPDGIYVSKTLTLDLDGHSLSGYSLNVGGLTPTSQVRTGNLTVIDSSGGNGAVGVTVRNGGTLVFNPENDSTTLLQLEVWGGTVELYGGKILRSGLQLNHNITLGNLLPGGAGLAYYRGDTQLTLAEATSQTCDLVVKSCSHGGKNGFDNSSTTCPYCNAPAVAETALNNSEGRFLWRRFANLQTAIDADRNGGAEFKLLTDVTGDYTINGTQNTALDLNGHSIKGTVTVKAAAGRSTTLSNTKNTTTVSIDKVVAYKGAKLAGSKYPAVIGTLTLAEGATWKTILNDTALGYKVLNADGTHKWYARDDVKGSQLNNVIINRLPITFKTLSLKVDGKKLPGNPPKVERGTTVQICADCNASDVTVTFSILKKGETTPITLSGSDVKYTTVGTGTTKFYVAEYAFNDVGSYTISFTATKDGYSVTSTSTKLTVTKPDLRNAEIEFPDGNVAAFNYVTATGVPTFVVTYKGQTLEKDVDFTITGGGSTYDVGPCTLTIKATDNGDYTGSKSAEWTVRPLKVEASVGDIIKTYDGTTNLPENTKITFKSADSYYTGTTLRLAKGTDYEVLDAKYNSADASETEKTVSFTIKLKNAGYVFEDGTTQKDFTLNGAELNDKTFKIDKAAIASDPQLYQTVFNDLKKTYEIDLNQALNKILPEGSTYGDIVYGTPRVFMDSDYYPAGGATIGDGTLSLRINKAASSTQGKEIGTVTVEVETTNYQRFTLTIHVSVKDKLVPVPAKVNPVSAKDITYGQTLADSELTVNGTMQDRNTLEEVKGTFAWTNKDFKPDASDSYEAEWTFTPAKGYEEYATATGKATVKVNKADPTFTAPTANTLTYTGSEQPLLTAGSTQDGTMKYRLGESGEFVDSIPNGKDAGTYTVYFKVMGDGNHNDTEVQSVSVTINPLPISLLSVSSISKTYDGSADVTLTADKLTFFSTTAKAMNIKLPNTALSFSEAKFTKQQADGSYLPSPEVGGGKALSFTMTLTSNNYVFEGKSEGTVSNVFATDEVNRFTITKAAAPMMQPIELTVINGLAKTYLVNLPALPTLGDNCKYGSIKYEACNFNLIGEGGYANSTATITSNDEFQLAVPAVESQTEGSVGTVDVKITTDNYQDMFLTVEVIAKNKIVPVLDGKITATPITFGQILRVSTITGTMKDDGKTVEGTFEWTDPSTKPDKAGDYQAEWTFTPAEGYEEYATATGTVTIKVDKAAIPTSAIIAPTAQENLTYTGQEQALITAGIVTDYGTMQYSLTENDKYSQDIPTGTDAGTYTVYYKVVGDKNHNDTAPASVAVSIGKKPLTITGVTAASKPYDGTTNADISSVTFDNVTLNQGTDYNVTASFDDAGVGSGKNVTATVTLMGQAAKNYFLEQSSFPTTGSITKAAAPTNIQSGTLTITNGLHKTYSFDLSTLLPKLTAPCDYGTITYDKKVDTNLGVGSFITLVNGKTGELTLEANRSGTNEGQFGTITVTISTSNYQDINLTVNVSAVNQIKPVSDGTITAADITYGDALSKSEISGKMKDSTTGKEITGTFTWTDGTVKPNVGSHNPEWTFTPDESYGGKYTTKTGTAPVKVNPKAVTVSGITAKDKVYDGKTNATLDCSNAKLNGVLENDTLTVTATGTFESANAGEQKVTISGFKLDGDSVANNYVLAESGNQTETTATITAREATVTPDDNQFKVYEEKDPDLTYNVRGVLDGETLKGITLTRAEGENAGEYAITATADAGANPNYDVTLAKGKFTINPKPIDSATVKLGAGLIANGAEQTQTVEKVLLDGKELPADSYTVTDNTATAPGSYTLTITGKGNYTGTVKQTYAIAPAKAEDAPGEEITIGIGKVNVNVQSEGAVPPAALLTDKAELLAMLVDSGDITADELAQIANGASVDIVLTVKEANVPDEVKAAMAQAAKGYTIGQYLDISLFKYMTVNGSQQAGVALHTTKDVLTISVVVPDALINTNSAVNRTYCIVRNHEGTITVLDAAFDAASKTLTFKTDRFSIYAIAYKDTAVPSSGSNPGSNSGSNNSSNDSETKKNEVAAPTPASSSKPSTITAMPQTGDTSNPTLYVVLLVASLLGLAVVFVCKRRNNK